MNPYFPAFSSLTKKCLFLAAAIVFLTQTSLASTISGFVYTKSRVAIADIDVELLNENYQSRGRTKTDSSGRYTFTGLADGYYTIRVMPFRYDLEDQEATLEVTTIKITGSGQGNAYYTQDFYLSPKRGGLEAAELGVVFAQDVPKEARELYEAAIGSFSRNRPDEAIIALRNAVTIFPNYYDALVRLGREMFTRRQYGDSAQIYMKAVEVNPKSATSLYYLGYSLHNIDRQYNKAALVALTNSLKLAPASPQVLFLTGRIQRIEGDYANSEKNLVQAKKLTKANVPEIHSELAQLYGNNLKKYNEAADELEAYLKASKVAAAEQTQTRKIIADLREKAKNTPKGQ